MFLTRQKLFGGAIVLMAWIPMVAFSAGEREYTQEERMKVSFMRSQSQNLEAIEFLEKLGGMDDLGAGPLFDLCSVYMGAGKFGKMVACFDKLQHKRPDGSVLIRAYGEATADVTATAYVVMSRGYTEIGDFRKAISAATHAQSSAGKKVDFPAKLDIISAYAALGFAYARSGDVGKTQEQIAKIRDIVPNASDDAGIIFALNATKDSYLLQLLIASKDYMPTLAVLDRQDAVQLPEATRQWFINSGKAAELESIESFGKLTRGVLRANTNLELGRLDGLQPYYDAALSNPRFQALATYWEALFFRGRLAEKQGRIEEAIQFYRQAVDVVERQRSSISADSSKISFVGNKQVVYGHLINALVKSNRSAEAFEYAERAKSRALVDMLATREQISKPELANGEVGALLSDMSRASMQLATFNPEKATSQQAEQIRQTRGKLDAANEQLRKAAPELASLVTVTGISESRLRALLQPDEILVEYYYLDNDLYGFIVTPASLRAVRLDAAGLSDTVRKFRTAVQNPQSKDTPALAKQLHARLVAPLGLPAQGKLLVVPHGVLHYLPFNALRDAKGDMIDRYSMRLLPSASVLNFLHQRKAGGKGLLVLGNPDLGNPQYDLPGAQKEAAEIARLRPDTTLLMRASATKAAVKAEGGKYAYLHFASHGKFNPERPLQSGLYLAGREDEGMLTVDELYSLNLNADLVTLSACETALGSIDNGDDVIGLTRGFFYAGASSIIASLWPVDDDATYQMMTKFYGELARTSKADALRTAQLAVKAKYSHPFYWAAFQLTGNAR